MKKCTICGEFFNPAMLSEVFEHEHRGIATDKEYYGKEVKEITVATIDKTGKVSFTTEYRGIK